MTILFSFNIQFPFSLVAILIQLLLLCIHKGTQWNSELNICGWNKILENCRRSFLSSRFDYPVGRNDKQQTVTSVVVKIVAGGQHHVFEQDT